MATAIFPEIVLSSLRPLGEEVRRKTPQLSPEQLQDAVTGLGKVVDLMTEVWRLQREKIKQGVELKGFLRILELFRECVEETCKLLDILHNLMRTGATSNSESIEESRSQAEKVGKEVNALATRLRGVASPRELPPDVRLALDHPEAGNYEHGDDIIARLQRGEDL